MGRLISEDDVMRMLTSVELNNGTITDAKIELRNVKTAYDVDKVVEEIEKESVSIWDDDLETNIRVVDKRVAIQAIRKGGAE